MFSVFFILGKIWTFILEFLSTKAGQIILLITAITLSIIFAHNRGFKKGVEAQVAIQQSNYERVLAEKLKEQTDRQAIANKEAIDFVISQQEKDIRYVEKIKEIVKIIEKEPEIIYKEGKPVVTVCPKLSKEDFKEYQKKLREIK